MELFYENSTAWNMSVFGVILDRIFPHWDWIRQEQLQIQTLFTQCSQWLRVANYFCKQLHLKLIYRERISSAVQNKRKLWKIVGLVVVLEEHGGANLILCLVLFTFIGKLKTRIKWNHHENIFKIAGCDSEHLGIWSCFWK